MPAGFEDMTLNANRGKDSVIDAMVEDGFFTREEGTALKAFYDIYYFQDEELKKAGKGRRQVARLSPTGVASIPRVVDRQPAPDNFNEQLTEGLVKRIKALEEQIKQLQPKVKNPEIDL